MTLDSGAEFRVGQVITRTLSVLFRNIVPFGLLAVVITSPSYLYGIFIDPQVVLGQQPFTLAYAIILIVQVLFGYLLMATVVYGTVAELRGNHATIGECIGRGLPLLFPVFGVAIVVSFIIGIGLLLLVVPGIIAMIYLWVAIPVAVVERPGVFDCLPRSSALTKGNRWKIFGLALTMIAIYLGMSVIVGVALFSMLGTAAETTVLLVVQWAVAAFISLLWSVMIAVSYHDLRVALEGVETDEIAAVFE